MITSLCWQAQHDTMQTIDCLAMVLTIGAGVAFGLFVGYYLGYINGWRAQNGGD